jgi:UDPglucose 6-dehydrogenase
MIKLGIVGNGFVGQASAMLGSAPDMECMVYDIDKDKCIPKGCTISTLALECDVVFICVPTPMSLSKKVCDTSIVEICVNQLREVNPKANIVLRSTVPPGTCDRLRIAHMPEYLTEKNWYWDVKTASEWHLGVPDAAAETETETERVVAKILRSCEAHGIIRSSRLIVKKCLVTEATKYFRNAMLATKLSLCNEFESYCGLLGISWADEVRDMVITDTRIGGSHTQVPGSDGKRGFGGTCLPKDLVGLIGAMDSVGASSVVLSAVLKRNNTIDRPEQDWINPRSCSK